MPSIGHAPEPSENGIPGCPARNQTRLTLHQHCCTFVIPVHPGDGRIRRPRCLSLGCADIAIGSLDARLGTIAPAFTKRWRGQEPAKRTPVASIRRLIMTPTPELPCPSGPPPPSATMLWIGSSIHSRARWCGGSTPPPPRPVVATRSAGPSRGVVGRLHPPYGQKGEEGSFARGQPRTAGS